MSDLILLTSQRNEVFQTIQDAGFVPSDFEWEKVKPRYRSRYTSTPLLRYRPASFYFSIARGELGHNQDGFIVEFSPGEETQLESNTSGVWQNVVWDVTRWLGNVRREIEIPDLWEKLSIDNELVQRINADSSDNLPFTQSELLQVRKSLEEIKTYLIQANVLSEDQRKLIDARFSYMEAASTRMGRKDWINIVVSNLLSIVITLSLSGDSTRDLFRFAGQIVRQLLGTMQYLAGPH